MTVVAQKQLTNIISRQQQEKCISIKCLSEIADVTANAIDV